MFSLQRVGLGKHRDAGKVDDVVQDRADACMYCFTYERLHITVQGRRRPCRDGFLLFGTCMYVWRVIPWLNRGAGSSYCVDKEGKAFFTILDTPATRKYC